MKRWILALLICVSCCTAWAYTIEGVVVSDKGKGKKNVQVLSPDSKVKAKTDKNGAFVINVDNECDSIDIYVKPSKRVRVSVGTPMKATLYDAYCLVEYEDKEFMAQYTIIEPRNPNVLTHEQIMLYAPQNIYDLLRGRIPGLVVNGESIRLRINGHLAGDPSQGWENGATQEPLFIIDGVECRSSASANGRIFYDRIERVEVVKEAQFGLKAPNGVIYITHYK